MREKISNDVHRVVGQDEGGRPDRLRGARREDHPDPRPMGDHLQARQYIQTVQSVLP